MLENNINWVISMVYEFNIRERTLEDSKMFLEFINQLDIEAEYMLFEEGERNATLESIRKNTVKTIEDGDICYIAIYNNKIVGFIIAVKDRFIRTKHIATLVLGVLEEFQSLGLGSILLTKTINCASEKGIVKLELTVVKNNKKAIALYKKHGFVKEGLRKKSMLIKKLLN